MKDVKLRVRQKTKIFRTLIQTRKNLIKIDIEINNELFKIPYMRFLMSIVWEISQIWLFVDDIRWQYPNNENMCFKIKQSLLHFRSDISF